MPVQPYPLAELTLVPGPPIEASAVFLDFQERAQRGESVADHPWAQHEYAALDALTHRAGAIGTHSLLETLLGSVLQLGVIVADVERRWVRHADGQLYVALTICSEDVRPRAAGLALHEPALVDALNAAATPIAALDDRRWMAWSSRRWLDAGDDGHGQRTADVVRTMAERVLADAPAPTDDPLRLVDDLLVAIRHGRALADTPHDPVARELRALRHVDPLRVEWTRILMDAFFLGALDESQLAARVAEGEAKGLAYLYLGRERSERLKADPAISPRFRAEIAARTCMTAYALERLAPAVSSALFELMRQE